MNRSNTLSYLLTLIFILSSAGSFAAGGSFEGYLESASCFFDSSDSASLENDEDADDLDSHSSASHALGLSAANKNSCTALYSKLATLTLQGSEIRAPPLSH